MFLYISYQIIIICYIDNLIITSPNNNKLDQIINKINKTIKLQDLGILSQFLGIDFKITNNKEVFINQNKYTNVFDKRVTNVCE